MAAAQKKTTTRRTRADSAEEQMKADRAAQLVCVERKSQIEAYIAIHPNAADWKRESVGCEAAKYFARPIVVQAIADLRQRTQNKNDKEISKIIKGIAIIAEFDPRQCYNDDGTIKPLKDMPDEVALAIESLEFSPSGAIRKFKVANRLQAQRLLGSRHKLWNPDDAPTPPAGSPGPQVSLNLHIDASNASEAGRIYREIMKGTASGGENGGD
jgi:hypothetical protein